MPASQLSVPGSGFGQSDVPHYQENHKRSKSGYHPCLICAMRCRNQKRKHGGNRSIGPLWCRGRPGEQPHVLSSKSEPTISLQPCSVVLQEPRREAPRRPPRKYQSRTSRPAGVSSTSKIPCSCLPTSHRATTCSIFIRIGCDRFRPCVFSNWPGAVEGRQPM